MRGFVQLRSVSSAALICSLAAVLVLLLGGCSSSLQMTSKWSEEKIKVDGDLREWSDSTLFVQKDDIRFGVMNDNEFLYVCVMSSKPNLGRQIMFRGMTVWFDPLGGDKKTYGVRFPMGMAGMRRGEMPMNSDEGEVNQRGNRSEGMDRQLLNDFEFIGPTDKDIQMVSRLQGQGVEMHLTSTPERFVYELKVPLAYSSAHPYSIESHPGSSIGIGLETNTFQRPGGSGGAEEGRGEGGGGGRGGRGGMGGFAGGRGGRMGGGAGANRTGGENISFDVWAHVHLAEKSH